MSEFDSQFESAFEAKFYKERQEKLARIAELGAKQGLKPLEATYPNSFECKTDVPSIRLQYDAPGAPVSGEQLEAAPVAAAIAGRIVAIRLQGKAGFATLQQGGQRLQIYVRKDDVGEDQFELYRLLDLGDHVGVRGTLMRTRTGELTLKATAQAEGPALTFLAKAMLPLPDKFSGLGDIELRYRRRYLDLFTDTGDFAEAQEPAPSGAEAPAAGAEATDGLKPVPFKAAGDVAEATAQTRLPARAVFEKRAAILRSVRRFFDARGYIEVETPMLHTIAGGAAARTFDTHHNAEDMKLTLRIAPELYLKRLVVGGFDRVYEINRNFRNEGVDTTHNPEFTMLEFYQAYANYHDLMDLTEELIKTVAMDVNGTTKTTFHGEEIDLGKWTKLSMREAIIKFWPVELTRRPSVRCFDNRYLLQAELEAACETSFPCDDPERRTELDRIFNGFNQARFELMALEKDDPLGKVIAEIFELLAEPHLIQPTIIYDFPLAVSPLSKVKPDEPDWVERFEFYIGGFEVGNAFSELNDPDDQLRRFQAQVDDKDPESMAAVDHDYVRALGYGLPPTAGEGIGIDRLTMLLTGSRSIRDVILFPLMRPVKAAEPEA